MKTPNITFKSLLSGISSIEKKNKIFKSLSKEGQRLEIAWDVLQMLLIEKLHPSAGWYWDNSLVNLYQTSNNSATVCKKFNEIKACTVCARGAVMVAQIRLGNTFGPENTDVSNVDDGLVPSYNNNLGLTFKSLSSFSVNSMKKMESEYEDSHFDHPYHPNSREKLMNMMCNILVNGDFKTSDKTDYLI